MAGEIQLNSTTFATESSGSITAELDTIRPNTTNGSLTLQGDSSNAGVTGLTIDSSGNATFSGTGNNLGTVTAGTISGGTIGSGVVFPAGHPVGEAQFFESQIRVYVAAGTNSVLMSVTPTFISTSNKFLIFASIGTNQQNTGGNLELQVEYSGTDLATYPQCMSFTTSSTVNTLRIRTQIPIIEYLDVPATGSVQLDIRGIATTSNFEFQDGNQRSTIIIQEFKS